MDAILKTQNHRLFNNSLEAEHILFRRYLKRTINQQ